MKSSSWQIKNSHTITELNQSIPNYVKVFELFDLRSTNFSSAGKLILVEHVNLGPNRSSPNLVF